MLVIKTPSIRILFPEMFSARGNHQEDKKKCSAYIVHTSIIKENIKM
jgi:hypothetical protein